MALAINFEFSPLTVPTQGDIATEVITITDATSWSIDSPFPYEILSTEEAGNQTTLTVDFDIPGNNSKKDVSIPVKVRASNKLEEVESELDVVIAGDTNSSTSVVLIPLESSPKSVGKESTSFDLKVFCASGSTFAGLGHTVDQSWVTFGASSSTALDPSTDTRYIANFPLTVGSNTGADRTATLTFSNSSVSVPWVINQTGSAVSPETPTGSLTLDIENPYTLTDNLNFGFSVIYTPTDATLSFTTSSSEEGFLVDARIQGTSTSGNQTTATFRSQWSENTGSSDRTATVTFNLVKDGVTLATKDWVVNQASTASTVVLPSVSVYEPNISVGPGDTQTIIPVNYNLGNVTGTILDPVIDETNFPGFQIIGSSEDVGHNAKTVYYTASFSANTDPTSRQATVDFEITYQGHSSKATVTVNQGPAAAVASTVKVIPEHQTISADGGEVGVTVSYEGRQGWTINLPKNSPPYNETVLSMDDYSKVSRFTITIPANGDPDPKEYKITYSMTSGSATKGAIATIVQDAEADPLAPRVKVLSTNPINSPGTGGSWNVQVGYTNVIPPAGPAYTITRGAAVIDVVGPTSYPAEPDFTASYTVETRAQQWTEPFTGSVVFKIATGSTMLASDVLNIQMAPGSGSGGGGGTDPGTPDTGSGDKPTVRLLSTPVYVGNTETTANFLVEYFLPQGSSVKAPVWSYMSSGTANWNGNPTVSSLGNNLYRYTYAATIGTNETLTNRVLEATFEAVSGSYSAEATGRIIQGYEQPDPDIILNTTLVSVPYDQTVYYVTADYYGISSVANIPQLKSEEGTWTATMNNVTEEPNHVKVIWKLQGSVNETNQVVKATFIFRATGIETSNVFRLEQGAYQSGTVADSGLIPAWKDTNTVIGTNDIYNMVLKSGNQVLFREKMFKAPNENNLIVNFNRLVESFLAPREFPTGNTSRPLFSFTASFSNQDYEYSVVDDWSYNDEDFQVSLSRPYQKELALGQYLVYSLLNASTIAVYANGYKVFSTTPSANEYYDISRRVTECGTWQVKEGSTLLYSWNTVDAKYVIYYYNKHAGWDSFVVKGPVVPSVTVARDTYTNPRRRSRIYQSNVVTNYKINTGILTDTESPVVSEIVASPEVVLHDLENKNLISVKVITDSVERKTFRNQGRQFATYQFDLESETTQVRR